MKYYRVRISDRRAGGIEWIADFVMTAKDGRGAAAIVNAAYPGALECEIKQI